MPKLLVFSRDPGPTNQLIAVVEALRSPPAADETAEFALLRAATSPVIAELKIATRVPGDAIWRGAGYTANLWSGADERAAEVLIAKTEAGLVLTGTSDIDEPGDRMLWRAARRMGIESHAVLDHPANLALRFRDARGEETRPDWFYVPDEIFLSRLAATGIPAARIRVIGDLHHVRMRRLACRQDTGEVERLRTLWGAGDSTFVILFASECGREMAALGRPSPYDETEILGGLLNELARGQRPGGGELNPADVVVVVRPHPRDAEGKYNAFASGAKTAPRVAVSAEGSPPLALMAANLVVGMNSSLLYEALELGRAVVSLTGHDIAAGKSRVG